MASRHEIVTDALAAQFIRNGHDPDLAPTAARLVAERVTFDDAGNAQVPVADVIEQVRALHPELFGTFTVPANASTPDTRSQLQKDSDMMRQAAAEQREARIAELTTMGNPWMPATRNLTRQGLISNLRPDLAARLQAEARA